MRSNTASCCKTRFSPSPPPLPYFTTVKASSEENKAVLDDVQRADQVKVSVVYRLWHTFPTQNVSAGSECLQK